MSNKFIFYILLLGIPMYSVQAQRQVNLFQDYDFTTGKYSLLVVHFTKNYQTDTSLIYYVEDIKELEKIKENFVFETPAIVYPFRCWDSGAIFICKQGQFLERLEISSNCRSISSKYGVFDYLGLELLIAQPQRYKAKEESKTFQTLEEGRKYISSLQSNPDVLMTSAPAWVEYEGRFLFYYTTKRYQEEEDVAQEVTEFLQEKYPTDTFQVIVAYSRGGSATKHWKYEIHLHSNKDFFEKFKKFPVVKNEWIPFKPNLKVYWRTSILVGE